MKFNRVNQLPDTAKRIPVIMLFVFTMLLFAGCSLASEPVPAGPIQSGPLPGEGPETPSNHPRFASGELIFQEHCLECHGEKGDGDSELAGELLANGAELPDFTDQSIVRTRTPQEWYSVITMGTISRGGLMPPWSGSLTSSQRWDVAYYLYSLSAPEGALEEGETLYNLHYVECFGEDGEVAGFNDLDDAPSRDLGTIINEYLATCDIETELTAEETYAVALYAQNLLVDMSPIEVVEEPVIGETAEEPPADSETPEETAEEPEVITDGSIEGTVLMNTGATLPDPIEITLQGLTIDMAGQFSEFLNSTITSGSDGSYRFESVPMDIPQSAYIVTVSYGGVTYGNGAILDGSTSMLDMPIVVYESTTDEAVITLSSLHVIVNETEEGLFIGQLYVFTNSSDKVYVYGASIPGITQASVGFSIPQEAQDIQFENGSLGANFIPEGNLIRATQEIYPGLQSHTIFANYFIPVTGNYTFDIPLLYETDRVTVMVSEGSRVQSGQLEAGGERVIDGQTVISYTGEGFSSADTLSFTIKKDTQLPILPIALGAVFVALIGAGIYIVNSSDQESHPAPAPRASTHPLLDQIAELDKAYEEGRINRIDYEAERADLKARIIEEQ